MAERALPGVLTVADDVVVPAEGRLITQGPPQAVSRDLAVASAYGANRCPQPGGTVSALAHA